MNTKNPYLNSSVLTPVGIIVILIGYVAEALRMSSIIKMGLPSESFFPFMIFLLGFLVAIQQKRAAKGESLVAIVESWTLTAQALCLTLV